MVAALAFYFFTGNKKGSHSGISWRNIIPSYITDSIYYDTANSLNADKIELGRYLFYDRRLSINKSKSCASCHDPQFSFTDSYRRSIGALGDLHQRNSSPLINIIFRKYLTATDSSLHYPEQQINNPMFHDRPVELGWKGNETEILERIKRDNFYTERFKKGFPDEQEPVTVKNIQYSIVSFIKTIVSFNAPYDQFFYLKKDILTASEKRGIQLFFCDSLACSSCHGGNNFSTPVIKNDAEATEYYFNTGLYNLDDKGNYPSYDHGLTEHTHKAGDMGKYRVPTLRNLAFTAPYYHDGSAVTLEEVLKNYENGGRKIDAGLLKGNGTKNPYKSVLIKGFSLTSQQRKDVINFLLSLSDSSLLKNKNFSNPFQYDETKL